MSRKVALTGAERKAALQTVLAKLAGKHGSANVTRRMVAKLGNVSESLVSTYFGDTAALRKAAKAAAKKQGIAEPSAEQQEIIGVKLRAHGPRDKRDTRKRSVKEVEAIKRKASPGKKVASRLGPVKPIRGAKTATRKSTSSPATKSSFGERETKPTKPAETKPTGPKSKPVAPARERKPTGPQERKSAAREPKAPPPLPELPTLQQDGPPPLPKNLVGSFP